jgi:CheY-like chemotaxis protein
MISPTPITPKMPRRSPRNRVRLLVADQNEVVRDSLAVLLERAGYGVHTAASAGEALEIGAQDEWDCLVTDLDLPDVGGLELYARLLFQGRSRFPAVFLSVQPPPLLEVSLRGAPWVRLMRKPCTFPSLLAALEQCLAARRDL